MAARTAGQIIKRGERKWLVRVDMGRDANGKRVRINKTVQGIKKDAQQVLNRLLRDKDMGSLAEPARLTLNDYLDHWFETAVKGRVKGRTYRDYRGLLKRHVRPSLGNRHLSTITPVDVQRVYSLMLERELSARTVRYTHTVLRNALAQAVKWRMATHNPAEYVDLPKQGRQEMRALSDSEAKRFLTAARGSEWFLLFNLLITSGLRPGEALALQWRDVDLISGTLTIVRTITWDIDGKIILDEPKTPRSRRSVSIPSGLVSLLKERREEAKLLSSSEQLFTTADGKLLHPDNFPRRHFKDILRAAGLPEEVRLYDLRHTCATLLLLAGVHPKVVSERLGHSSITLTLDTYSHVLPTMQREASDKLEAMLYGPEPEGEHDFSLASRSSENASQG